ncbi:MAG: hypothetical protein JWL81_2338, partial [Verrucomicrobiales bacterium]|nr:hypothetical protein [Verrucomicrobiales bacterium]
MKRRDITRKLGILTLFMASALPGFKFSAKAQPPVPAPATAPAAGTVLAGKLVTAARSQVGRTLIYDPAYVSLKYPMGDVPEERG